MPIFPKGGPGSPRDGVAEKERHVTCIIPPMVSPSQRWHVVQHKNFPQRLSMTRIKRMRRQRADDRRQLIDVPVEIQKKDVMELEKVKEKMVYSSEKNKFWKESY